MIWTSPVTRESSNSRHTGQVGNSTGSAPGEVGSVADENGYVKGGVVVVLSLIDEMRTTWQTSLCRDVGGQSGVCVRMGSNHGLTSFES